MTSKKHYKGTNFEDVQEMNRTLIIRLMRKMGVCSRADLSKVTGLKQATITHIISDFIEWGLVRETGSLVGEKGRRSIGITLNSQEYFVIGVRLTRKYFMAGLFDIAGNEMSLVERKIEAPEGPDFAMRAIKKEIADLIQANPDRKILGIGVALPGPFIRREGRIVLMTEFPGWEHISIMDELKAAFDLPVVMDHDANAGALAEWWMGSHNLESGSMVYLAVGQGIGAGIVNNGNIYRGAMGVAGEIGHMSIAYDGPRCDCGNRGCLLLYCSTTAFLRQVKQEKKAFSDTILKDDFSFPDLVEAIKRKDDLSLAVFRNIVRYLGIGIVNIINMYNPDIIVIGDELSAIGDELITELRKTISEHALKVLADETRLELSSFRRDPAFVGAAALAIGYALSRSSSFEFKKGENNGLFTRN